MKPENWRNHMTIWIQRLIVLEALVLATGIPGTARAHAQTTTKTRTFYIGTCKPGKADYTTIQEAVTGVPSGSVIDVCPGNYPEQVTIRQPLTLQGVSSGNNANVVITAPPGGLTSNNTTEFLAAAQLAVINAGGTVDISSITVDGTEVTGVPNGAAAVGILYDSSSGTLNHVVSQNMQSATAGEIFAIFAFDDSHVGPTFSVKNSVMRLSNEPLPVPIGVEVSDGFTIDLENNSVFAANALNAPTGISLVGVSSGTVSANTTDLGSAGIGIYIQNTANPITVSGNSVNNSLIGIVANDQTAGVTISNNSLSTIETGISADSSSNLTIKGNQFLSAGSGIGIDLGCQATGLTLSGNTFMGGTTGIAHVPSGASLQKTPGTFIGVPNIEQLCP
jgi:parallel beta-helix repeat protein